MATIRKNAVRKIEAILKSAVMIRVYRYDDMGCEAEVVSVARVLECLKDADSVREYYGDILTIRMDRGWCFTAYASVEAARRDLTQQAFAKYFPNAA